MANASRPDAVDASPELNLLLAWPERRSFRSWAAIVSMGAVFQASCFLGIVVLANAPAGYIPERRVIVHKTPLYLPPDLMTQKAPNRMKPAENIQLADLLPSQAARASRPAPAPSTRHFEVPAPMVPKAKPTPQIEPPPNLASEQAAPRLPPGVNNGLPLPAPPPPPTEAKNDKPFQNIGSDSGPLNPHPTLRVPKPPIDGSVAALAPTPNAQHMIITDNNMSPHPSAGIPGSTSQSASQHMEVELKSDTEAPDFRAYLARVLAVVRANWRLVTPESVRLGTLRGENTIELIINRDGKIPKLVIGQASNIPALDQASVAGVSMSNPLPPLPDDFKGEQVRLALTFKYNVKD